MTMTTESSINKYVCITNIQRETKSNPSPKPTGYYYSPAFS